MVAQSRGSQAVQSAFQMHDFRMNQIKINAIGNAKEEHALFDAETQYIHERFYEREQQRIQVDPRLKTLLSLTPLANHFSAFVICQRCSNGLRTELRTSMEHTCLAGFDERKMHENTCRAFVTVCGGCVRADRRLCQGCGETVVTQGDCRLWSEHVCKCKPMQRLVSAGSFHAEVEQRVWELDMSEPPTPTPAVM